MKKTKSNAVANDPIERRAFQKSGLPMHPACIEFDPQNLGIVSINSDGQIVEANEAFLSMSGYSHADLPLDMAAITPVEWHSLDERKTRQLAENGHCLPWQKQILTRHGHLLPVVIGAAALKSGRKQSQYFVANTEDHQHADIVILEYQTRLRNAAVEISLSKERERRAIAGELHDNIGQELAIAKLKLSKLRAETTGSVRVNLDELAASIGKVLDSCRTLSHSLATPVLYKLGLVPAIRNLAATLFSAEAPSISLRFDYEVVPLSNRTKIILYRVIRELFVNILKHAQASNVEISGTRVGEMFRIIITDDGIGFDARQYLINSNPEGGLGLFLVRERLWHIGGSFELESTIGKGTKATLVAPLDDMHNPAESI